MRPCFVVRNGLFGLLVSQNKKDHRAIPTFKALQGKSEKNIEHKTPLPSTKRVTKAWTFDP